MQTLSKKVKRIPDPQPPKVRDVRDDLRPKLPQQPEDLLEMREEVEEDVKIVMNLANLFATSLLFASCRPCLHGRCRFPYLHGAKARHQDHDEPELQGFVDSRVLDIVRAKL